MESPFVRSQTARAITLQAGQNSLPKVLKTIAMKILVQIFSGDESAESSGIRKFLAEILIVRVRINQFQRHFYWLVSFSKIIRLRMMFRRSNSFAFC